MDRPPSPTRGRRTSFATPYEPALQANICRQSHLPHGFDVDDYLESLSHRWANAALGHRTSQVGTDGSVKLLQRVPEPALIALRGGRVPHLLALTIAGWIATVAPPVGFDPGPYAAEVREPARDQLAEATAGTSGVRDHVLAVLRSGLLPDDLVAHAAFEERVVELVTTIVHSGIRSAAKEAIQAVDYREVS